MQENRSTAIIYTSAVCNLNCTYCYIDKNKALVTIDNILKESFEGDYYINFMKDMFPDPYQLRNLETWGGEPFIGMDRCYRLIDQMINHFPNFNSFFSSTNLTTPDWMDQFKGLVDTFARHPEREFSICIQLSLDGPKEITDRNRGEGVTEKFTKNFGLLVDFLRNAPKNITFNLHTKPTFDMSSVEIMLDKQKIIEYYQFMESYIHKIRCLNKDNVRMSTSIPNTASPLPHTVEDGVKFAKLCKLMKEVEKENVTRKYFKYYERITLYSEGFNCTEGDSFRCTNFTCGTGYSNIGFLPYDRISTCHNGFVDLISEYKKESIKSKGHTIDFRLFVERSKSRFCLTKDEYKLFESQMIKYNIPDTTSRLTNMVALIITMARSGQILERYIDPVEALNAARFLRNKTAFCVRDNHAVTGSITLQPLGIYRLLLNGAKEIIEDEQ